MPRLPTTDLTSDAIKAFLGITGEVTLDDICKSDRVRGEYFDINYLHGMAQAYYGLLSALAGFPLAPAGIREGVRLAPQDISNFRNYGYDVAGYSIIAFSGEHNDNKILKYNNDEYWNDFYSAPIRDMRTAIRATDGLLWVGGQVSSLVYPNERGLFSFNGSTWTRYTTPQITGQYVYAIELGTDPYMWVGTEHGFSIFDRTTFEFTHYYIGAGTVPTGKLPSNVITCFAYNSDDESMWVGTANGLIHITDIADPAGWNLLQVADGLVDNNVKCLMVGPDGDCWAGFDGHGMVRITEFGGTYTFDNINTSTVPGIITNHVNKIAIEPSTYYVWAATNMGIQYFHWNAGYNDVTIIRVADGLPSDMVYTVRLDYDNRKWFGFDDHIGMIINLNDDIRVWGQWHGGDSLNIHEFLIDYEPQQIINEISIGAQIWMADNWRGNKRFMYSSGDKSKVYNYNEYNREYLGGLFTWEQVNDPDFCPAGWHVPSFAEWWELIMFLGGTTDAGDALKSTSILPGHGWISSLPTVTNSTGFSVIGTGYANIAGYFDINEMTQYWTSDVNAEDETHGVTIGFYYNYRDARIEAHQKDTFWFPVRLIKDITANVPVALPATNVLSNSFTANWEEFTGAMTYYLDISTSPIFTSYVPGYQNLEVGDVLFYNVSGLEDGVTYYYRIRANDGIVTTGNSNRISTITPVLYTCCASFRPDFESHSVDHEMFLSAGLLVLETGTIGDYVIEWREGSTSGAVVFTSGVTADPGDVQAQHPFTNEIVFAGTLYPVIIYIYVNGVKYTSEIEVGARFSPDLISCLDPIIVDAIECDTIVGADSLYNYSLSYTNGIDLADNKSRTLRYNICGPGMQFLAVEFQAYQVADQLKIYYCTALDRSGTLIENWVHGNRDVGGATLTGDLYPASYPTNPRIALYGITGQSPLCFITDIRDFTFVAGDYLRIEITGAVYEPSNSNTNWYIKLKSLNSLAETFIADKDLGKIADTPVISYLGDPDCRYEISYNTIDDLDTVPLRTTGGVPDLYKYLWFWTSQYANYANSYMENPVRLGMNWKSFGSNYGLYSNTGFASYSDLDTGEQIGLQKSGDDYIFTFSDTDDYNKMKSDIAELKAHSSYTSWLGYTDTDSRYYARWYCYFKVAESVGDNTGTTIILYFWFGNNIAYDDVNKKITWTCQVPVNNLPDPGDCNNVDTVVASALATMNSTKIAANFTTHSHVRSVGWFYATWPFFFEDKGTSREFLYAFTIEDAFVDGLVDMAALGFCKGIIPGANYANMWALPHYMDKVTFTDYSSHTKRLFNWILERRKLLRTEVCADTEYEEVYSIASADIPVAIAATGIDHYAFDANWELVEDVDGYYLDVATDIGFTSFVSGYNNKDVGNVLTSAVTLPDMDTTYYYRVRAYTGVNVSDSSNIITTTTTALDIPVAITAPVIGNINFTAGWNASHLALGYRLDVSTDPAFGSFVSGFNNLDVGNFTSYAVPGLTDGTNYYYRIRAYNGSHTSTNSNSITVNCPLALVITSRGTGAGVAYFYLKTNASILLTLTGAGRFYSNTGGTLDESITWNKAVGAHYRYVKVTSGTSKLMFSDLSKVTGMGDVAHAQLATPMWHYDFVSPTANLPGLDCANWYFPNCVNIGTMSWDASFCTMNLSITQFSPNLQKACLQAAGTITGTIANIPSTCTVFGCSQTNAISGNITSIPSVMTDFHLTGSNTLTGNISNLPSGILKFSVTGLNTISGDITNIPTGATQFVVGGYNTLSGNITNLKSALTYINITGYNTITGDIANFKSALTQVSLGGYNSIYGNVSGLSRTMTSFVVTAGSGIITGTLSDLPSTLATLQITGNNTLSGNINTFPAGLTSVTLYGGNTISGSLAGLTCNPSFFHIGGSNTISGTIANLKSNMQMVSFYGNNTINGSITDFPAKLLYCIFAGQNTIDTYTTRAWTYYNGYSFEISPYGAGGLSSAEIDQLLIDLDTYCTFANPYYKTVRLQGTNAAPTAASLTARNSLIAKGVTLVTN